MPSVAQEEAVLAPSPSRWSTCSPGHHGLQLHDCRSGSILTWPPLCASGSRFPSWRNASDWFLGSTLTQYNLPLARSHLHNLFAQDKFPALVVGFERAFLGDTIQPTTVGLAVCVTCTVVWFVPVAPTLARACPEQPCLPSGERHS